MRDKFQIQTPEMATGTRCLSACLPVCLSVCLSVCLDDCLISRPHQVHINITFVFPTSTITHSHNAVTDIQIISDLEASKKYDASYWFPFLKKLFVLLKNSEEFRDTQALLMVRAGIGNYLEITLLLERKEISTVGIKPMLVVGVLLYQRNINKFVRELLLQILKIFQPSL